MSDLRSSAIRLLEYGGGGAVHCSGGTYAPVEYMPHGSACETNSAPASRGPVVLARINSRSK